MVLIPVYQSGQSSTFPYCPSSTKGKRNDPSSCCCLGNVFVEDSDSLPCKTHIRTRSSSNRLIDCTAVPCEKHSQTSGVTCTHGVTRVQICVSVFKMHQFGGAVSRFYSLICFDGNLQGLSISSLALKRFLDFEREYLLLRTSILILVCNLTYFPSPYLLEVGKQNWWKSLY